MSASDVVYWAMKFDGGHKRDRFLTDVLDRYVEWMAFLYPHPKELMLQNYVQPTNEH